MSALSLALEPTPNLRFADPLSPLDLCTFACFWREESALTNTPGGGGGLLLPLFRPSTFDCRLWQIVSLFLVFGPFSISFRINTYEKTGGGGGGVSTKNKTVSFPIQGDWCGMLRHYKTQK